MAINKVGVVGGGLMGHGIAQICAQAGWDVVLREVDEEKLARGSGKIEKQLGRAVEKGKMEQAEADAVRGRISGDADYGELADCDLVIEAMTENLGPEARDVERDRRDRQGRMPSSPRTRRRSSVIDQAAATARPDRFIGLHFFNPAQVMPLLEVVQTVTTDEEALRPASRSARSSARPSSTPRTRRASSSTACSSPTCSTRSAPTRRASARSRRSTSR